MIHHVIDTSQSDASAAGRGFIEDSSKILSLEEISVPYCRE
jgi:hypothetical protein